MRRRMSLVVRFVGCREGRPYGGFAPSIPMLVVALIVCSTLTSRDASGQAPCTAGCNGAVVDLEGSVSPDRRAFEADGVCATATGACFPLESFDCDSGGCPPGCHPLVIDPPPGVTWEARRSVSWITFCGPGDPDVRTGVGSATLCYRIEPNSGSGRDGQICLNYRRGPDSIDPRVVHCICQKGVPCTLGFGSACTEAGVPPPFDTATFLPGCDGGVDANPWVSIPQVSVSSGSSCNWEAVTTTAGATWLGNGSGGECGVGIWQGTETEALDLCWSENDSKGARFAVVEASLPSQPFVPPVQRVFWQGVAGGAVQGVSPSVVQPPSGGGTFAINVETDSAATAWFARIRPGGSIEPQFVQRCDDSSRVLSFSASGIGESATLEIDVPPSPFGGIAIIEVSNGCGQVVEVPILQTACVLDSAELNWMEVVLNPPAPPQLLPIPATGSIPAAGSDWTGPNGTYLYYEGLSPLRLGLTWEAGTDIGGCGYWVEVTEGAEFISLPSGSWGFPDAPAAGAPPTSYSCVVQVEPNLTSETRTGTLRVNGTFDVPIVQAPCGAVSVTPDATVLSASGGEVVLGVEADAGFCPWSSTTDVDWLTPLGETASGAGDDGEIRYEAAPNSTGAARSGQIVVNDVSVQVTQLANDCLVDSMSPEVLSVGACGTLEGDLEIELATQGPLCSWTAVSTVPWIEIVAGESGTGPGAVVVASVAANTTNSARVGYVTANGVGTRVEQAAGTCGIDSFTPASFQVDPEGAWCEVGDVSFTGCLVAVVTTPGGGFWVESSAWWVEIVSGWVGPIGPLGTAEVRFRVYPNPSDEPRAAVIHQLGQPDGVVLPIVQSGGSLAGVMAMVEEESIIRLEPGVYEGPLDFGGRAMTVESIAGPGLTIIESSASLGPAVVMEFDAAEGEARPRGVLRGLTIRSREDSSGPSSTVPARGGGILIANANAEVDQCVIEGFTAIEGGGIHAVSSDVALTGSTIRGNVGLERGGGLLLEASSASIESVVIQSNTGGQSGGGISIGGNGEDALVDLGEVSIVGNSAESGGGVLREPGAASLRLAATTVCGNAQGQIGGEWIDAGANVVCGCIGDLTGDGHVDGADLAALLSCWGCVGGHAAATDLDGSGVVDGGDLGVVLSAWGQCP